MGLRIYPLEPLQRLRRLRVDAAARDFATAIRRARAATCARQEAERRREECECELARARGAENEALVRGELRAVDLARAGAWASRTDVESASLAAGVERARSAEAQAREAADRARSELASRRGEARVVAAHRSRWTDARRLAAEASDEEATSDAWRSRR